MKKHKNILLPAFYFVIGVIFLGIIQHYDVIRFLNSGFFIALVTLGVGLFAIYLYIHQRNDHKRDIAKLILQEIRYAERHIKIARERKNVFLLSNKLLPTCSWYDNIYMFVNDLEETERDTISDFYSKVNFLDKAIAKITEFKINNITPTQVTETISQPSVSIPSSGPSTMPGQVTLQQFQLSAEIILKEVADQVEFLFNTPAADRLRELSHREWYQI